METRKVQRTGKSTYIVSLPKSWASKNGIQSGAVIYISQSDNGSLMLSADKCEKDQRCAEVFTDDGKHLQGEG